MEQKKQLILLAGPTASGKSRLAVKLAQHLNGEIINAEDINQFLTSNQNKKQENTKNLQNNSIYRKTLREAREEFEREYFSFYIKQGTPTSEIAKVSGIEICGKTGTAQNPHGEDHSIFIAFAPIQEPKIAIAVYVENGGWGSTWAVPIGSLIIEKYLSDTIINKAQEAFILNGNLIAR